MRIDIRTVGRFVTDLKIREVTGEEKQAKVINTSLAVNEGEDRTTFIPCEIWNGTAEFAEKYFKKGSQAEVKAHLKNKKTVHFKDTEKEFTTTDLVAVIDEIGFVGKKED